MVEDGAVAGLLTVGLAERDAAVVVAVAGEVDLATVPQVRAAFADALGRLGGRRLVVDLTAVTFLASAGLGALADLAGRAPEQVVLAVDGDPVRRMLRLGGLDGIFRVVDRVAVVVPG